MAKPTRDERLAAALRANLRKRKGQGAADPPAAGVPPEGATLPPDPA